MLTTQELLTAAKTAAGIPSNYRLARVLDVPETTVQRWNTGRNAPDDAMCFRLAELAGLDPGFVVASIHAQRASDEATRSVWASIAARLQTAGATAAAVILSAGVFASPDAGAMSRSGAPPADRGGLYIMSTALRSLRRHLAMRLIRSSPGLRMAWL